MTRHAATKPVLLWFRNDLRLADHAALLAALETGQPILPVYVVEDAAAGPWAMGAASRWWLHHSLTALAADLRARGADLVLRRGDPRREIPRLIAETHATEVFTGGSAEPSARALDRVIADTLRTDDVPFHRMRTTMLFHPDAVRGKSGGPYSVYTAFAKTCRTLGPPQPPRPAPLHIPPVHGPASDRLDEWRLLPVKPDWAGGLRETWTPGEAGATARLRDFSAHGAQSYAEARDRPGGDGTSMLSPHLHFGEISAGTLWHQVQQWPSGASRETFIRELLWREFCLHLLWHHPALPDEPLRPAFAAMPWLDDDAGLRAWQQGQTGIPIVDAGMRQLWQIGWMHNRVRMVVASFLVKHLLIPWQKGEAWFWDTLVDADLANNAANWQWVAGCGADAAPYFRIFNPVLQGRKFDPAGDYVRRFVPELERMPDRYIHEPWNAPESILRDAGVRLGATYRHPIVSLEEGRTRALAALDTIKAKSVTDDLDR
jgi:deoxyribodipyrimidine photo-lyase